MILYAAESTILSPERIALPSAEKSSKTRQKNGLSPRQPLCDGSAGEARTSLSGWPSCAVSRRRLGLEHLVSFAVGDARRGFSSEIELEHIPNADGLAPASPRQSMSTPKAIFENDERVKAMKRAARSSDFPDSELYWNVLTSLSRSSRMAAEMTVVN